MVPAAIVPQVVVQFVVGIRQVVTPPLVTLARAATWPHGALPARLGTVPLNTLVPSSVSGQKWLGDRAR